MARRTTITGPKAARMMAQMQRLAGGAPTAIPPVTPAPAVTQRPVLKAMQQAALARSAAAAQTQAAVAKTRATGHAAVAAGAQATARTLSRAARGR
jgi:hypothetical protein